MRSQKITLLTPDKIKIVGIFSKKSSEKIVVLCHGITSNKNEGGIFIDLEKKLNEKGFSVFRFDFRGHGESGGKQKEMTITGELIDLKTVLNWVKDQKFTNIGLLGASFGGAITSIFSSRDQDLVKSLVLWNPALNFSYLRRTSWQKKYFNITSLIKALFLGYVELGDKKFKLGLRCLLEMRWYRPFQELKKFQKPVLFVHGDKDSYVSYDDSVKFSKLLKAKLVTVKGAEHGFQDKREWSNQAINETVKFFKQTL